MSGELLVVRRVLSCIAAAACFAFLAGGCKKAPPPPAPPEVLFVSATPTNVPIFEEWIGTLDGFVNAQIRAQVTGYLQSQNYEDGSHVKKGDLLFQIDPSPFQAVLDQAEARLAQDQAQAGKTEQDVKRYTPLAKQQAVSQEELDNAIQANLAANAQIKADEAAVETARLNLGFTRIISPVEGLAGIALAQVGDLVSPSSGILTTVSTVNPIKVYFPVSERSYLGFWRRFLNDTNGHDLPLRMILSDGSEDQERGRFYSADRQVNPNTGTLQIVGLFSNADFVLRPGQYARIRAQTATRTNAFLVPQRAVSELQGNYQVALIGETNHIHLQPVKLAEQLGSNWIVTEGLKPGDRVVVEGILKAKEGVVVNPKPFESQAK
jgi:RND family efflux transporter MFP subunit